MTVEKKSRIYRGLALMLLVSLLGVGLGCGGDDAQDNCAEDSCELGVCESSSGRCINPDSCDDDFDCAAGYECSIASQCIPRTQCNDNIDCAEGVCRGGACVNPDSCQSNDDCVEHTYCSQEGRCAVDPCNQISCERGVCLRGQGTCVSARSCTPDTEAVDCVAGEKCADGACEPAETFCDAITCDRGVCSFEAGGCADADDCQGDRDRCLEGMFCDSQDRCQPDLCEQDDVECDQGVCAPAAGACENANPCASSDDCLADHLCVEGACRLSQLACGDADGDGGCPGNQTCHHDETSMTATCQEPATCQTSRDCLDERQCAGQTCLEAVACRDDYFEPNDTADAATALSEISSAHRAQASLCGDDDYYTFVTTDIVNGTTRGQIIVDLDVTPRDVGLGRVDVALLDSDGTEKAAGSTGELEGHLRLTSNLTIPDHGEYTIVVSGDDDLSAAGLTYDLSVNILPDKTLDFCEQPNTLELDRTVLGNTETSDSFGLSASCTEGSEPAREVIYAIDIPSALKVTFELTPQQSTTDLTLSVRGQCTQPASERGCVDAGVEGEAESLTVLLEAGTHYVIVQPPPGANGGAFNLEARASWATCTAADSYCTSPARAQICDFNGDGFSAVECSQGCHPSTGRCFPPAGDLCFDAFVIDAPANEQIDLAEANNSYQQPDSACFSHAASQSTGPDYTYRVDLDAQEAFTAEVFFADGVNGSLYILDECIDEGASCLAGASGTTTDAHREELRYSNFTDDPVSVYLVVDTAGGQVVGAASLTVDFFDITCPPDDQQCTPTEDVERCDENGIAYRHHETCDSGCRDGYCLTGDTCNQAIPLSHGDSITKTFTGITSHITTGSGSAGTCDFSECETGAACDGDDPEYIFEIDMQQGDLLTVTYSGTTGQGIMYLMETCGDADTCLENGGRYSSTGTHEFKALATHDGPHYLAVARNSGTGNYNFTIDIDIGQPDCDPAVETPTCLDNQTIEYCSSFGEWVTEPCYGCSNAVCQDGDTCNQAISLGDGDSFHGYYDGITSHLQTGTGSVGACNFTTSTDGDDPEYIFEVDLQVDDVLSVEYDSGVQGSTTSQGIMYVLEDCSDVNSCVINEGRISSTDQPYTMQYRATTAGTHYLVVSRNGGTSSLYDFQIDVDISPIECDPSTDQPYCFDASTFRECVAPGIWQDTSCPCTNDVCLDGNTCGGAIPMSNGDSDVKDFSGSSDMSVSQGSFGGCNFTSDSVPVGPDYFYAIDLNAGETLTVTYDTGINASPTSYGVMYILDTCGDINSCLINGGRYTSTSTPTTLTHTASSTGTVYLVVSRNLSGSTSSYDYQIDIDIQ